VDPAALGAPRHLTVDPADHLSAGPAPAPAPDIGCTSRSADELVWYVAYGSNLLHRRLMVYLAGGTLDGNSHSYRGCRDRTPPRGLQPTSIPHPLVFCGTSARWGNGGTAAVDVAARGHSIAVAWLVRRIQFEDLVAQENGLESPGVHVELPEPGATAFTAAPTGRYRVVVGLAPIDGIPAVAITVTPGERRNAPTAAYRALVHAGLVATAGLSSAAAQRYLDVAAP